MVAGRGAIICERLPKTFAYIAVWIEFCRTGSRPEVAQYSTNRAAVSAPRIKRALRAARGMAGPKNDKSGSFEPLFAGRPGWGTHDSDAGDQARDVLRRRARIATPAMPVRKSQAAAGNGTAVLPPK